MLWKQKLSVMTPMRDGVKLSCDIRFPEGDGPFPVLLVRTPYNKARNTLAPEITQTLDRGYVHIIQDCRGKHESEGQMTPILQEIADGEDTVAWVAAQDFCDGNVVMAGGSYVGWTQLAAAATNPPALKGITPAVMCTDTFGAKSYTGGAMSTTLVWWTLLCVGRSQQADPIGDWDGFFRQLPVSRADEILGFPPVPVFRAMMEHKTYDDFWQARNITQRLIDSDVPVLLGVGWFDVFGPGAMKDVQTILAARRAQGRDDYRVIAGPWGHGLAGSTVCGDIDFGKGSMIDIEKLQRDFLDHWVKDAPLPAELQKPVMYFLMGANEWRNADEWPPAECKPTEMFLDCVQAANSLYGDGRLSAETPCGKPSDQYVYDPMNPTPSIAGTGLFPEQPMGPVDQRPAERRDDVLCYSTGELGEPLDIVGMPIAELFVESDAVDTDFFVRLCDVHPSGKSMFICDGAARMRYRDGLDKQVLMTPGETCRIRIELGSTAIRILPGHRLRLEITSSCFPRYIRNLNCETHPVDAVEADVVLAKNIIHHSSAKPSKITLPVIE